MPPGYPAHMTGVQNDEPILLPVGHYMGARYQGKAFQEHSIRGGWNSMSLDDTQLKVYFLGHGTPERMQAGERNTRRSLVEQATSLGLPQASKVVDWLVQNGALVEVLPGTPQIRDFARTYRFCPMMIGLGNSPDTPWMWDIGFIGQPVITVSANAWKLWGYGVMSNTLWEACESWAASNRRINLPEREFHDPAHVLDDFLDTLPALIAAHAGYLDFPPTPMPA